MNKDLALKVLKYWHQVEFFQLMEVKALKDSNNLLYKLTYSILENENDCLPWRDRSKYKCIISKKTVNKSISYKYKLYLGIFKRAEITKLAKDKFQSIDIEEIREDFGETCSATIMVNKNGVLDINSLKLSTCPWAIGKLNADKLSEITFKEFKESSEDLKQEINKVIETAKKIRHEANLPDDDADYTEDQLAAFIKIPEDEIAQISTFEIQKIIELIEKWAHYKPSTNRNYIIAQLLIEKDADDNNVPWTGKDLSASYPEKTLKRLTNLTGEILDNHVDKVANSGATEKDTSTVSIMNSFFIQDLELAIKGIENDNVDNASPLARYLSTDCARHPDLLTEGIQIIIDSLNIKYTPLGRWPDETVHIMSTMQQFAINTINKELNHQGIYSVNGPPGTGKTTMLRDLIADNIVRRAEVLAGFNLATDTFEKNIIVNFDEKTSEEVKVLKPTLAGFEMVVVSSNNAAVKNITEELPQIKKALGKDYKDIGYFKPVAQKLTATHEWKNELHVLKDNDCWGLISVALGNSANRKRFINGSITIKTSNMGVAAGSEALSYLNLEEYIASVYEQRKQLDKNCKEGETPVYRVPTFAQSKAKFTQSLNAVKKIISEIADIEDMPNKKEELRLKKAYLIKIRHQLDQKKVELENLNKEECQIPRYFLDFFKFNTPKKRIKKKIANIQLEYDGLHRQFAQDKFDYDIQEERCNEIDAISKKTYSDIIFYKNNANLEEKGVQRRSYGHCKELNKARTQLFIDAMALHESWIIEAYNDIVFKNTINKIDELLNGKIKTGDASLAVWRMLFMLVPVISSTFASVESQFKSLGQGDIGWLFIDEAGQAAPQLAVGSLFRSKRVIVVGDPKQIEPVFTVPLEFVEGLGLREFKDDFTRWTPSRTSVQKLADLANPYGTEQISVDSVEIEKWLGSPLRVHRRCKDPMFKIANRIAYSGKMFHAEDDYEMDGCEIWGKSCWFHIPGKADDKFVREQGEAVLGLILKYHQKTGFMPELYIISPFRSVKNSVKKIIAEDKYLRTNSNGISLNNWVNERIGTVHTFQGKEESNVLFVLGADTESERAAKWAAGTCNILNVAITRAKKYVYIIGDYNLWSPLPHFKVAAEILGEPKNIDDLLGN